MKRDIAKYVARCIICQQVKIEHQRLGGMLQPLEIPEWKWKNISMNFIMGLSHTLCSHDLIWVIIDRLTKLIHFLPVKTTNKVIHLVWLSIEETIRLLGVPTIIVSDRDPKLTSRFLKALHHATKTNLNLNTSNYP